MKKSASVLFMLLTVLALVAVVAAEPQSPTVSFCVTAAFQGDARAEVITLTVDGRPYGSQGSTDPGEGAFFSEVLSPVRRAGQYCLSNPLYEGEYDFYARAADTLLTKQSAIIQFGGVDSVDMGTLREGDINENNSVNATDLGLLGGNWLTSGANLPGDLNEDTNVNATDLSQLGSNWLTAGDTPPTARVARAATAPTGTATVRTETTIDLSNITGPGQFVPIKIMIDNPNGENINVAQFEIDYNETYLNFLGFNAAAGWNVGTSSNTDGVFRTALFPNSATTATTIEIGTMNFLTNLACAAPTCGVRGLDVIAADLADPLSDGTLYGTPDRALEAFLNCPNADQPCLGAGQGLAVALSSFGAAQPLTTWVAVLAAAVLLTLTTGYMLRQRAITLRR